MMERRAARAWRAVAIAAIALVACDAKPPPPVPPAPIQRDVAVIRRDGNHLVGQPSPYLEQHAHNPVDWYPWGPAALELARREHRLLFVSVGYSTCHWCHVMEHETFEDDETARLLNARFVSIKIDREERPDLDALFVEAVMRLGQSAGWPLNVVLTPDLEPVFGGTYFPRTTSGGRPGLADALREIDRRFVEDPATLAREGKDLLRHIADAASEAAARTPLGEPVLRAAMASLSRARDPDEGGFGSHQKFPNAPLLLAELRFWERLPREREVHDHVALTLDRMRRGGVRDQLVGTFHRYAVDRSWHVPHFEKTLYDNAQLAALYLEASRALTDPSLEGVGRAVLDDLITAWQEPDGGFIVGFDADDPGGEGAYYTWTLDELTRVLGAEDGRIIAALFGVTARGDPSLGGRSVLHRRDEAGVARDLGLATAKLDEVWERARLKLLTERARRPPPAADDKELAAWNGLALMALADAARRLGEPRYLAAGERVARFLVERAWDPRARTMKRGFRRGVPLGEGFLDDYALTGLGLLRLHAASGDPRWLSHAAAIAGAIVERFYDATRGSFVQAPFPPGPRANSDGELPLHRPDVDDGVLPSGGSAAALFLTELGAIAGDDARFMPGLTALQAAAGRASGAPFSSGFFLVAIDHATSDPREVVIAGDADDPATSALRRELATTTDARVLPVLLPAGGPPSDLAAAFPALAGKSALHGRATAFVCRHGSCEAPTSDPRALRELLLGGKPAPVR